VALRRAGRAAAAAARAPHLVERDGHAERLLQRRPSLVVQAAGLQAELAGERCACVCVCARLGGPQPPQRVAADRADGVACLWRSELHMDVREDDSVDFRLRLSSSATTVKGKEPSGTHVPSPRRCARAAIRVEDLVLQQQQPERHLNAPWHTP
jgi:hypothetical protein